MTMLTVNLQGELTLPEDLLRHMGARPGSKIAVHKLPNGRIEFGVAKGDGKISDVFGMLKREGQKAVSTEKMNDVIGGGGADNP